MAALCVGHGSSYVNLTALNPVRFLTYPHPVLDVVTVDNEMASLSSPSPIRYLTFRNQKIPHTQPLPFSRSTKAHAGSLARFSNLLYHLYNPLLSPFSPRSWILPPRIALRSLYRDCSPSFCSVFSSMTTPRASSDSLESISNKSERVVIKGRVQGVFYRNWTIENANNLGLKGWVRNRRDGSVEALFSGPPEAVQEMKERCRRGPPDAMVTNLQVFPSEEDPGTGFQRKPTI